MVSSSWAKGQATPKGVRPERRARASMPEMIFSSDLAPMPGRPRSSPARAFSSSSSNVVISNSRQNKPTFFGPNP